MLKKMVKNSSLQEYLQSKTHEHPSYTVISEIGYDHDKTFTVKVSLGKMKNLGSSIYFCKHKELFRFLVSQFFLTNFPFSIPQIWVLLYR